MSYKAGTVTTVANNATITGTNTQWANTLYNVVKGQIIVITQGTNTDIYTIEEIKSNTSLLLSRPAIRAATNATYEILTTLNNSVSDDTIKLGNEIVAMGDFMRIMQAWTTGTGDTITVTWGSQQITIASVAGLQKQIDDKVSGEPIKLTGPIDIFAYFAAGRPSGPYTGATGLGNLPADGVWSFYWTQRQVGYGTLEAVNLYARLKFIATVYQSKWSSWEADITGAPSSQTMTGTIVRDTQTQSAYSEQRLSTGTDTVTNLRRFRYAQSATIWHEYVDSSGINLYTGVTPVNFRMRIGPTGSLFMAGDINGSVVTATSNSKAVILRNTSQNGSVLINYENADGTRRAFVGFGSGNNTDFTIVNDAEGNNVTLGSRGLTVTGKEVLVVGKYGLGVVGPDQVDPTVTRFNGFFAGTNFTSDTGRLHWGFGAWNTAQTHGFVLAGRDGYIAAKTIENNVVKSYELLKRGDCGIGSVASPAPSNSDFNEAVNSGFWAGPGGVANPLNPPPQSTQGNPLYGAFLVASRSAQEAFQLGCHSNEIWFRPKVSSAWKDYQRFYTTANTTKDTQGNLRAASPIVKVFGNKYEVNEESDGVEVERLDKGVYLIKNILGLNSDESWGGIHGGIVVPKGINGHELVWVDYKVKSNGDIVLYTNYRKLPSDTPPQVVLNRITTYPEFMDEKGDELASFTPCDIPDGHWIDVRVHMPEQSKHNVRMNAAIASSVLNDLLERQLQILHNPIKQLN